ncbi:MAG TPA: hypothetical protein VFR60_11185, partial [Sphingomicrobium sp.]|nr:hypothetical protein [Sphingomicrobium sp.]
MSPLDDLDPKYRAILCDIWGVVHDGGQLLPGAQARLLRWKGEGRHIVLLTNAPRPASSVQSYLDRLGLSRDSYDAITSSGEAGIAALTNPPRPVGFLGLEDDREDLKSRGVLVVSSDFTEVACTGLNDRYDEPEHYREMLTGFAQSGVVMHCLNPDRI